MPLVVSVPRERLAADLEPLPEGVELVRWDMSGPAPRQRIDLVVAPYGGDGSGLARLEGIEVRLVQGQSIGYEGVGDHLPDGFAFANASSVHETATAELAVALTLAAQRDLPRMIRAQAARRWDPFLAKGLADSRVTLLGFGGVGKAIAQRLAGFEVRLGAVATRARTEDGIEVRALDDLPAVLAETDVLIASLPGGDDTEGLLDAAALSHLPEGALVVNVGRGGLIDTDALVAEVRSGRLRAALDVTDPEPLPDDHALWTLDGALIAPHVGGASTAMRPRITALVREQIERMLRDDPPLNVVLGG